MFFFSFSFSLTLGHSKLFRVERHQVLNSKLCQIDELSVRMDLGRSNIIDFAVFKIKSDKKKKNTHNFYTNGC
jgi:hypothetical protein